MISRWLVDDSANLTERRPRDNREKTERQASRNRVSRSIVIKFLVGYYMQDTLFLKYCCLCFWWFLFINARSQLLLYIINYSLLTVNYRSPDMPCRKKIPFFVPKMYFYLQEPEKSSTFVPRSPHRGLLYRWVGARRHVERRLLERVFRLQEPRKFLLIRYWAIATTDVLGI